MICLLGLLFLGTAAFAQPVEGPYTIAELDSAGWVGFGNLHLMAARGDTVGFFYSTEVSGNPTGVYYAEFSFDSHSLIEQPILISAGSSLQGAMQLSDGEWICAALHDLTLWVIHGHGLEVDDSIPVATGQWQGPQCWFTCWKFSNCVFAPRVGGGFVMTMSKDNYFDMGGGMYEIDGEPRLVVFGPNELSIDFQWEWSYGYTFGPAISYPISMAEDTTMVIVNSGGGVTGGWWYFEDNNAETEPVYEDTVCAYNLVDLMRTPGGRLLGATRGIWQGPYPEAGVIDMVPQVHCDFLGGFGWLHDPDAVSASPSIGFAAVDATSSSVQLARLDTNGTAVLPIGTVVWRDSLHMIYSPEVSLSYDSSIIVAWREQIAWNEGHRLRIARCGWDTPLSATPQPEVVASPRDLALSAFPNPFNSTVTIRYELPSSANVSVSVFNLLGERIAVLKSGHEVAGAHSVEWEPKLGSGIYFVRMEAGDRTEMRKIVFLK